MSTDELQEILDQLNVNYGVWRSNKSGIKYRAIADNDRYQVIKCMLEVAKGRGEDKEYFRTSHVKEFIAKFFFPEPRTEHKTAAKRKGCYDLVYGEMRQAILEVWPAGNDIPSGELQVITPVAPTPKAPEKPTDTEKSPTIRPDMTERPYEASDELEVDEEFAKLLKEADDE